MREPSFNTWTSIFLFAGVQGLMFVAVLLYNSRKGRNANFFLAILTLLFSITLIEYVLWWTGYLIHSIHFINISRGFPFLYGPLLYYYFRFVFGNHKFRVIDLLALLPFLIFMVDMWDYYFASADLKRLWYTGKGPRPQFFPFWHWIIAVHLVSYATYTAVRFNAISKTQHEVRQWFLYLMLFFSGYIISYVSYFILIKFPWFSLSWDYMISFSMTFMIYFLAWFGYLQPRIFHGFSVGETLQPDFKNKKYKNSALTPDISDEIVSRLNNVMLEKKLYLDNDLRLEKLAEATNTGKHHLSQVINEKMGMTFFEYINTLRIKEAEAMLQENSHKDLNIIEIAYKSGFNNKVSFNNTFKKITGMTPTEYRKKKVGSDFHDN